MSAFKDADYGREWYLDGRLHREDGPAIEFTNGDKEWFQNGQYHRIGGPAAEYVGGHKLWYKNGTRHREDGPAVELVNIRKEWYQDGFRNRIEGPAIEYANGDTSWYRNGLLHRLDGPAIERNNGSSYWYIDDSELSRPQIKPHQIQRIFSITLALSPLELPPYVILWILEFSESAYISSLPPISLVKMLEGIRNSRQCIKISI